MSEDVEVKQATFEGWAIVEMMGHRKEIGYVTTQAFGPAVLFRVDRPELPEREFTLTRPEYIEQGQVEGLRQWCPIGTKVKRAAVPALSCLVAPGSLYAMTPCSEAAARTAIERNIERPLILIELPAVAALPDPNDDTDRMLDRIDRQDDDDDDEDEDDFEPATVSEVQQ
jgi:hypothetical protein